MASHVLDRVRRTGEAAVCDVPVATVSAVEVSPDAVARLLRTPRPSPVATALKPATVRGRRYVSPVSGHALEKLGHAIEYVTDEYVHDGCEGGFAGSRVSAIQLLMSLNRDVYYECPLIPRLSQRIRQFLHRAIGD